MAPPVRAAIYNTSGKKRIVNAVFFGALFECLLQPRYGFDELITRVLSQHRVLSQLSFRNR